METYHKINGPYKRHTSGPDKGKLIMGDWARPEFEYLANNQWEFTEKVDGTNIRIKLSRCNWLTQPGDFMSVRYGGRTDNALIPKPLLEHLEATFPTIPMERRLLVNPPYTARYHEIMTWMRDAGLEDVTLYGEGYGPKIQSGGKYRDDHSFVLFDVNIGGFWLDRANVNDVASNLGIDSVPVIGNGTLYDAIHMVGGERFELYNDQGDVEYSYLPMLSKWGHFEAEGIVARPTVPLFNRKGERIICKIKGVDFK